jgi:uncharacterized membrane protein YesL
MRQKTKKQNIIPTGHALNKGHFILIKAINMYSTLQANASTNTQITTSTLVVICPLVVICAVLCIVYVNVYCHRVTTQLQLTNVSYINIPFIVGHSHVIKCEVSGNLS